jgi:hypothetical protein
VSGDERQQIEGERLRRWEGGKGSWKSEKRKVRRWESEGGMRKSECGIRKGEKTEVGRIKIEGEKLRREGGTGTRRRPIGRDYAAAKDLAFDFLPYSFFL